MHPGHRSNLLIMMVTDPREAWMQVPQVTLSEVFTAKMYWAGDCAPPPQFEQGDKVPQEYAEEQSQ